MLDPTCSSTVRASKSDEIVSPASSSAAKAVSRRHLRVEDFDQRRAHVEVRRHVVRRHFHQPLEVGGRNLGRLRIFDGVYALREVGVDQVDLVEQPGIAAVRDEPRDALVGVDGRLAQHDRHDLGDEAVRFGAPRLLVAFDEELPLDRAVRAREQHAAVDAVAPHG